MSEPTFSVLPLQRPAAGGRRAGARAPARGEAVQVHAGPIASTCRCCRGLVVTARHFFKNLLKSKYTISYPEERRPYSGRYRGHHILTTRPDGSVRCVACFLCATNCPAECIHIEAAEQPDVNIEKYPVVYEIDMLRCVFCGYCVDACPEDAIIMSRNTDMAYFNREQSIVGKAQLMKPFTVDPERLGYRPYYPEEDRQRAKMRREAFDLVSAARGD